jgi:hypothetical protein
VYSLAGTGSGRIKISLGLLSERPLQLLKDSLRSNIDGLEEKSLRELTVMQLAFQLARYLNYP